MLESRGLFLSDWHGSPVASRVFMEAISIGSSPLPHGALSPGRVHVSGHGQSCCVGRTVASACRSPPSGEAWSPKIADTLPSACSAICARVSPSLRRLSWTNGRCTWNRIFHFWLPLGGHFLNRFTETLIVAAPRNSLRRPAVPGGSSPRLLVFESFLTVPFLLLF